MQFESQKRRKQWYSIATGTALDLAIALGIASLIGHPGYFWVMFLLMHGGYLVLKGKEWLATYIWYKRTEKETRIKYVLEALIENDYPIPFPLESNASSYFQRVVDDESLPWKLRIDAHTVIDIDVDSTGDKCDGLMAVIIHSSRPDFNHEMHPT